MAKNKTKFSSFITNRDAYFGTSVGVNFNGQTKYKTTCGGVISIIVTIIFILFATEKLLKLVLYTNPYKFRNTVYHNLEKDMGRKTAKELSFDYAVVAYNSETAQAITIDESYAQIKAY